MSPFGILAMCCTITVIRSFSLRSTDGMAENLVSVARSPNKRDVWVKLHGVTATESVAGSSQRDGVIVRRATDGQHLVQILEAWDHRVLDCKITSDLREIQGFEMATESRITEHIKRVAAVLSPASPHNFSFDFPSKADSLNLTVHRLPAITDAQLSDNFLRLMTLADVQSAMEECRLYQQRLQKDLEKEEEGTTEGSERGAETVTIRRAKRASALMIPGTLWCGPGTDAESYHQLGEDGKTDSCCRAHDHCPHSIRRWGFKYGIFNFRLYALSHCDCDRRFKRCLRDAGTPKAEVVADWYFDILHLSCFELRYKPTCVEYQGWFSRACRRTELVPYAEIGAVGPITALDIARNATLVSTFVVPATDDSDEDKSTDQMSTGSSSSDH